MTIEVNPIRIENQDFNDRPPLTSLGEFHGRILKVFSFSPEDGNVFEVIERIACLFVAPFAYPILALAELMMGSSNGTEPTPGTPKERPLESSRGHQDRVMTPSTDVMKVPGIERVTDSNIGDVEDPLKKVELSDLDCRIWKCVGRVGLTQGHRLDYQVKSEFLSSTSVKDLMEGKNREIYPAVEPTLSELEERSLFFDDEALADYLAADLLERWIDKTKRKVLGELGFKGPEDRGKVFIEEVKELAENCPKDGLDEDLREQWRKLENNKSWGCYFFEKGIEEFRPLLLHLTKKTNSFKSQFDLKYEDMSFLKRIGFSVSSDEKGVLTFHVPDKEALEYLWGKERELNPGLCDIPLETIPGTATDRVFARKQIRARVISDKEERLHDLFFHYLPTTDAVREAARKEEFDAFQKTSDHLYEVMQPWFDKIDRSRAILSEEHFQSDWLDDWDLKVLDASTGFLIDSLTTKRSFSSMRINEKIIKNELAGVWLSDKGAGWHYFEKRFGDTKGLLPSGFVQMAIEDMEELLWKQDKAS